MLRSGGILLGVPIGRKSLEILTMEALSAIGRKGARIVFACANPHTLTLAQTDQEFKAALNGAEQVVADGVGVSLMAKIAGVDVGPRITGTDYFLTVMQALEQRGGGSVFFFGSSEGVLHLIRQSMARKFPKTKVCGTLSPPFRPWTPEENRAMVAKINAARPDVLWVGMTAPKQEKWVAENRDQLIVPVIGSIGAVFDFFAGTQPRAPQWMCKLGLEWAYRLIREARRMWRRTFISAPKFVVLVFWHHLFRPGSS